MLSFFNEWKKWKIMQIDSFQVERFLTWMYTFFQSEKTRGLSPNFIKKLPFRRRRKKPTGRALNLAKHIIIISPGWYTSMVYISMCVDPMIRSIFHTNGSFLVLLVLLITDLDLDPRRWWWRVNFLKHDQIINSSCHTRLEFP